MGTVPSSLVRVAGLRVADPENPEAPAARAAPRNLSSPAGASSAESAGSGLRNAPVPPQDTPPRAARELGASPAAPGAGSSRGGRWETSWRMRGDKHLALVLSRMSEMGSQ